MTTLRDISVLLFVTLILAGGCASAGEEAQPSDSSRVVKRETRRLLEQEPSLEFLSKLDTIYRASSLISVKYNKMNGHSYLVRREDLPKEWDFSISRQCLSSCEGVRDSIRSALEKGRRIQGSCPGQFLTLIVFSKKSQDGAPTDYDELLSILVSDSGQCFELSGVAYVIGKDVSIVGAIDQTIKAFNRGLKE